jgi:pilus assembly protein CpaF
MKISEISGMEGETIMMQDLFEFTRTEVGGDGKIIGVHHSSGIRSFYAHQIEVAGFKLDMTPRPAMRAAAR